MALKTLFKQTFFYGLATVLPRMLSFLLVPLYTDPKVLSSPAEYGQVSVIFSYFVLFNVILAYGMETAFFRYFNKEEKLHGMWVSYNIEGNKTSIANYNNGKKDGVWTFFKEDKISVITYKDNKITNVEEKAIVIN